MQVSNRHRSFENGKTRQGNEAHRHASDAVLRKRGRNMGQQEDTPLEY
jgi:hypothetical protein